MYKFQKILFIFIFIFISSYNSSFADTDNACVNICDETIIKSQATLKQTRIDAQIEIIDMATTPVEGRVSKFSCVGEIWSDITKYFSGGGFGGFNLGALLNAAKDMACEAATEIVGGAVDTLTGGIDAAIDGVGYAVNSSFSSALNQYTGDITYGLQSIESLTSNSNGINGLTMDYLNIQLEDINSDYQGVLYVNTMEATDEINDKIGG